MPLVVPMTNSSPDGCRLVTHLQAIDPRCGGSQVVTEQASRVFRCFRAALEAGPQHLIFNDNVETDQSTTSRIEEKRTAS